MWLRMRSDLSPVRVSVDEQKVSLYWEQARQRRRGAHVYTQPTERICNLSRTVPSLVKQELCSVCWTFDRRRCLVPFVVVNEKFYAV